MNRIKEVLWVVLRISAVTVCSVLLYRSFVLGEMLTYEHRKIQFVPAELSPSGCWFLNCLYVFGIVCAIFWPRKGIGSEGELEFDCESLFLRWKSRSFAFDYLVNLEVWVVVALVFFPVISIMTGIETIEGLLYLGIPTAIIIGSTIVFRYFFMPSELTVDKQSVIIRTRILKATELELKDLKDVKIRKHSVDLYTDLTSAYHLSRRPFSKEHWNQIQSVFTRVQPVAGGNATR